MYQVDQKKPAEAGWNCSACENYNFKNKTACNKCEKERTEEDQIVTKSERKQLVKSKHVSKVKEVI